MEFVREYLERGIAARSILNFDHFIDHGLQQIVRSESPISLPGYRLTIHDDVYVDNVVMTPMEARTNALVYDALVSMNMTEVVTNPVTKRETVQTYFRVPICRLPIMLRSSRCRLYQLNDVERTALGECPRDPGGYFIAKKERVPTNQMRGCYNRALVLKFKNLYYLVEMRSMSEETAHSVLVQAHTVSMDDSCVAGFVIPFFTGLISAGLLFRAMGFEPSDVDWICGLGECRESRRIKREMTTIESADVALGMLGNVISKPRTGTPATAADSASACPPKKRARKGNAACDRESFVACPLRTAAARDIIDNEILPHMGSISSREHKAVILGQMLRKLVLVATGKRSVDSKDNLSNKRVDDPAILCYDLFQTYFKRMIKVIQQYVKGKDYPDIRAFFQSKNNITVHIVHCFQSGPWGPRKANYTRQGVSQVLSRQSYAAMISHIQRVVIPVGREAKNSRIRQLPTSHFGFLCATETPDGATAGIVLNLALLAFVSRRFPTVTARQMISDAPDIQTDCAAMRVMHPRKVFVLVNGAAVGVVCGDIDRFLCAVRLRLSSGNATDVSVIYDDVDNEIWINCDPGRFMRYVIDRHASPESGESVAIRAIDAASAEVAEISMLRGGAMSYSYAEVTPSVMYGLVGNMIQLPGHTQAPRNTIWSSMCKQTIGAPSYNYLIRNDTCTHVLDYPQKSLVQTEIARMCGADEMPSGINAVVAVTTYEGFNQEDSIIMNASSVDRGLFSMMGWKTVTVEYRRGRQPDTFCVPPPELRRKGLDYNNLDKNGFVQPGTYVTRGDVLIGRVSSGRGGPTVLSDTSVLVKRGDEGIVHRVTHNEVGRTIDVIIRRPFYTPQEGDKFASRGANKGTIGLMVRQEDMPFTADGITPDIIIDPNCIPSRMPINQLIECITGKVCALSGTRGSADPWPQPGDAEAIRGKPLTSWKTVEEVGAALKAHGYEAMGKEAMFSGLTGQRLPAMIFIGPTYYHRLKHNPHDKIHARKHGPTNKLTSQPLDGRMRDGGLRFGEMEKDAAQAHALPVYLRERMSKCSDPFSVRKCDVCGFVLSMPHECRFCHSTSHSVVAIPQTTNLFVTEQLASGFKMTLH